MDVLRRMLTQFGASWRALGAGQRMSILAVLVFTASAVVALVFWARRPDFVPLYSRLEAEDASSVVEYLQGEKIPYQLSHGGTAIMVPSAKLYPLRMELAAKGVVKSGHLGFELFDRTHVGMTDFVQKTNYRRALEGELARTIETLEHVRSARVHIVLPEERLFSSEERAASASIVLGLDPGYSLGRGEVAGIVQLVAGSVEGLHGTNVTLLAADGRPLTLPSDEEGPIGLTGRQLEARRSLESYLTQKAQSLLDAVVGAGKSVVRVDAEIDFQQIERSAESWDPNNKALRSESRQASEGGGDGATEESTTSNYEVSKTVEHILGAGQTVKRLSVAVVVDGVYKEGAGPDGKPAQVFETRPAEEIANLTRVVRNAIGIKDERGDVIEVSCVPLRHEEPVEKPSIVSTGVVSVRRYGPQVAPLVGLVVLLLLVRRSLSTLAATLPAENRAPGRGGLPAQVVEAPIESDVERDRRLMRERVEALARERPDVAAQLIRAWLVEKR